MGNGSESEAVAPPPADQPNREEDQHAWDDGWAAGRRTAQSECDELQERLRDYELTLDRKLEAVRRQERNSFANREAELQRRIEAPQTEIEALRAQIARLLAEIAAFRRGFGDVRRIANEHS